MFQIANNPWHQTTNPFTWTPAYQRVASAAAAMPAPKRLVVPNHDPELDILFPNQSDSAQASMEAALQPTLVESFLSSISLRTKSTGRKVSHREEDPIGLQSLGRIAPPQSLAFAGR
jgi:hypothetical protein